MYLVGLFKKLIIWILTPLFREIISQEVQRIIHVDPPKLKELRIANIQKGNKLTVWDALMSSPIEITLCVNWVDTNGLEDFKCYRCADVSTLRSVLYKLPIAHNKFNSVSLHVVPHGSTKSIIENLVASDRHLLSSDLPKLTKPLIKWIEDRPELLI
jgi:hypothetical protein